ncbi:reverse transcriptase domain-containing protein [Oceanobacillus sojae]|uniref:reverse transcriptase domain-containing protein n=1 Tax=Oceanobacillus sojae TaxID=582851 RepID=UPI0020C9B8FB|nr:reverse transcriptase domain-containing protein [Oceanobacillus sojae]
MLEYDKYPMKKYIHFDRRVRIEKKESYLTNRNRIALHSFLPFIHYKDSFDRNIGQKNPDMDYRPIKNKNRDIMYAGHLDNYIFKFYAEKLNCEYNSWTSSNQIDECSIAYRDNKDGSSNIEFAAEIINSIVQHEEAYIIVGDFTKYFDYLNHKILKERVKTVLKTSLLEEDWYNVFRSVTKYGYYEKSFLEKKFGSDRFLRSKGTYSYFKQFKDFRAFQREYKCEKNLDNYGIPQGTAISAVLANVYSINFDKEVQQIAKHYSGLYRRYSDDYIIVIPKKHNNDTTIAQIKEIDKQVRRLAEKDKIIIQEEKTGLFEYSNEILTDIEENKESHLDYLGFVFDGANVQMRGKSPYKFYRKANQLIDKAISVKEKKKLDKIPYRKSIYSQYTDLGTERKPYGNFITYAKKAQNSFDKISPKTNNLMMQQIKNRKKKIEKKLGIRIHSKSF